MCLCDHLCHGILQPGQLHGTQEVPTRKISEFWVFCRFFPPDLRYEFYTLHALYFSRLIFFEKLDNQPALTATRLFLEKPPKRGDHQMVLILGKSNNANRYGKFEGCPPETRALFGLSMHLLIEN